MLQVCGDTHLALHLYFLFAGRSMFYFCWVSVARLQTFKHYSWGLLVGPYIVLFCTSFTILVFATLVLWKRLPASNKTRTHILKQNAWCVFVLTSEILIAGGLWMSEYISIRKSRTETPNFCCQHSFVLAIAFATVHSLRGVVDCITWFMTFSIGPKDVRYLCNQAFARCRKKKWQSPSDLTMPLMMPDSTVGKALRKDVMYCINRGILDLIDRVIRKVEGVQNLGQVVNPVAASVIIGQVTEDEDMDTEQKMLENPFELNTRKIKFAPSSNYGVFSFVSMEPSVFYLLWKSQKLNLETFKQSFHIEDINNVDSSGMLEKFTEGKSGSFFYFTHDHRYIIKTVNSEEEKFLRKIASSYYRYVKDNPDSLIVRLYGLYQVRLAWEQKYISVILMENIFHSLKHLKIHEKYDLKGSTVGRRVKRGNVTAGTTLKDLNLQKKVYVGPENKTAVLEQLAKDTAFLAGLQIMDYSMILGIHDHQQQNRRLTESIAIDGFQVVQHNPGYQRYSDLIEQQPRENSFISANVYSHFRQDFGGIRSYSPYHPLNVHDETSSIFPTTYDGQRIEEMPVATYYFGIIDILQEYNLWKKSEHFWKTSVCRRNANDVSVIDPDKYRERFLNFMANTVFE
ncbi:phosphatidylinositol 4-phosphate 5-kinase type-1 beta-like isoform X2 [Dysidea avara]|uniref:phosphatidylinositol 4-phosphate 5-kinase type-1 beta-like isoform X2 n=1 Tax=Dysidea avara TaxID=196820 RepID=UPI0033333ECB